MYLLFFFGELTITDPGLYVNRFSDFLVCPTQVSQLDWLPPPGEGFALILPYSVRFPGVSPEFGAERPISFKILGFFIKNLDIDAP